MTVVGQVGKAAELVAQRGMTHLATRYRFDAYITCNLSQYIRDCHQ